MKILAKSSGVALLVAAFGLAAAPTASAQPTPAPPPSAPQTAPAQKPAPKADAKPSDAKPADPKALFASGEKKFKAGDYAGALADFDASNAAKPSPDADRYIGLMHDNLGHFPEAVVAYERFLANVPPKMKEQGDETKRRVDAIKAMPGKVHVETSAQGAAFTVDPQANQNATPTPAPADIELSSGKHTIHVVAEGYEAADKEIEVGYASKQDVRVDLVKKEAPPPPPPPVAEQPAAPPPPPPPEPRSKVPAYVTGAVAIVAAGVGTAFGLKALSQSDDFKANPTTKSADDGENNALVADMMFGIAITFGVTSAVLFLSSDTPANAQATPPKAVAKKITVTPSPYVTPSGGGASALVRF